MAEKVPRGSVGVAGRDGSGSKVIVLGKQARYFLMSGTRSQIVDDKADDDDDDDDDDNNDDDSDNDDGIHRGE